jgi:hypothetical protein
MDWQYRAALSRIETLERELANARELIADLEADILSITDPLEDSYREVGLFSNCCPVVLHAARRALLIHWHPDRWSQDRKGHAAECFRSVQATFERIEALRQCGPAGPHGR